MVYWGEFLRLWSPIAFFTILFVLLLWKDKLPKTHSIQDFASVLNSRGGNILILSLGTIYFFTKSMQLIYYLIEKQVAGQLTVDNAVAMTGLTWVTGSAFGGAFGALLKTATGENSKARSSDEPDGGGSRPARVTVKTVPGTASPVKPVEEPPKP